MKQLFIAWVPFQRRSISMKSYFKYELRFLSFAFKSRLLRPLEYVLKGLQTLLLFLSQRPQIIWIQLPPTLLLHLVHLYKVFLNPQVIIIADCHNATFRSPWISIPGTITFLNRCDLVLIHNDALKEQVLANGIDYKHLYVLEDPPASVKNKTAKTQELFPHPWILLPCSFNRDEPIQAVIDAAHLAPEITFVLTGNTARAQGIHDLSNIPNNIKLTGFLPTVEFDTLICNADVILGLTKLDGIQLSVANEALGVGKPMVLSNTLLLKKMFYKGSVFVDSSNPKSIAKGCREALLRVDKLTQEVINLRRERKKIWLAQAFSIDKLSTTLKSS